MGNFAALCLALRSEGLLLICLVVDVISAYVNMYLIIIWLLSPSRAEIV